LLHRVDQAQDDGAVALAPPSHGCVCRGNFSAMGFRIISGTATQEFVENVESATAALDRVRQLMKSGLPNIRVITESGHACSPAELEGLAEFENESDDS
jgi:hypothetical protein